MKPTRRIESEKAIVSQMIRIYCHGKHGTKGSELCTQCHRMMEYAHARLTNCRFQEKKTSCKNCSVHCYKPEMREIIQKVMRYAGPRMLLHNPVAAIRHLLER